MLQMSKWPMQANFWHLHFDKFYNDIKNTPIQGVLTPAIELWSFGSPKRLPSPHFENVRFILTLFQSRVATLEAHNFVCRPPIKVRFKSKLYSLLKAFQRYVAHHLHTSKLGQFSTFSGWKSNWQFDSLPFF